MIQEIKPRRKKYRLKSWVRKTLYWMLAIGIVILFAFAIVYALNDFEKDAKRCDEARGYTCSYYDVRQYLIHGE